jgi:two-component system OmpR family sensor kinase
VRSLSIRVRLLLWHSGLIAVILTVFGIVVLSLQARWGRAQFDAELLSISATLAHVMNEELEESRSFTRAIAETRSTVDIPGKTTAILDANGRVLSAQWRAFPYRDAALRQFEGTDQQFATITSGPTVWRLVMVRRPTPVGDFRVLVAGTRDQLALQQQWLSRMLLIATPIAVLLASGICWWVASSALRPLTAMATEAEAITARSLDRRLSIEAAGDETGQLARSFNRLLDRLAAALNTERQFMADASHELRTPVSVVRTAAEVTLGRPGRDEAYYRDVLTIVNEQSVRLGRIVEDMLELARADAGGYPVTMRPLDLGEVVAESVRGASLVAAATGVRLGFASQDEVAVVGDDGLLRQMITNLLHNAIEYTPAGGLVDVMLEVEGRNITIAVADTGCGIPEADRERVFGRFVRLDPARTSNSGAGLGLPIARWIAEMHDGTLTLEGNAAGGCTFIVRLPIAEEAPDATMRNDKRPIGQDGTGGRTINRAITA